MPGKSVDPRTLLIMGGAGGIGSILIQLARRLTGLTVVATAAARIAEMVPRPRRARRDRSRQTDEGADREAEGAAGRTRREPHLHRPALQGDRRTSSRRGKIRIDRRSPEFNISAFKGKAVSIH